jgi:hypothetical protein
MVYASSVCSADQKAMRPLCRAKLNTVAIWEGQDPSGVLGHVVARAGQIGGADMLEYDAPNLLTLASFCTLQHSTQPYPS